MKTCKELNLEHFCPYCSEESKAYGEYCLIFHFKYLIETEEKNKTIIRIKRLLKINVLTLVYLQIAIDNFKPEYKNLIDVVRLLQ